MGFQESRGSHAGLVGLLTKKKKDKCMWGVEAECGERLPLPAHGLRETLVGRGSTQRVWKLMDAGYGLSYVALPNSQESFYIHKIVDLNRFWGG